jgi:hypothetical protein
VPHWSETARVAEELGDWDQAIAVVRAAAECYSSDYERHNAHLWHMDLLARAGRHVELAALGQRDVHARRRLNRLLYQEGRYEDLRQRARFGVNRPGFGSDPTPCGGSSHVTPFPLSA